MPHKWVGSAAKRITFAAGFLLFFVCGLREFAQLKARVDLVVVPVSVKDSRGHLVTNLTKNDFLLFEDGKPQTISNFSIDPQPLCAAIVIDDGVGGMALRRVAQQLIMITSGFSAFDQMAAFRYDHVVWQLSDFTADHPAIEKSFRVVEQIAERNEPADVGAAPPPPRLGLDGTPSTTIPIQMPVSGTSRLLYDAVYDAATALAAQPDTRRKMILLVSNGNVTARTNEHSEVQTKRELLLNSIELYGVLTDFSLIPSRYSVVTSLADATGGDVYGGARTKSMEDAFSRITVEARNQYVLGYVSNNELGPGTTLYRTIEVRTKDPRLKLRFRQGYIQKR